MKAVDHENARHHLKRAGAFFEAMRLIMDDMEAYGASVALLAVHTSISLADGVLIVVTGKRSNEQDHRSAVKPLKTLCGARRIEDSGVRHFNWLLSRKTDFAYGDKRVPSDDMNAARVKAQQFRRWVFQNFKEVRDEIRDEGF